MQPITAPYLYPEQADIVADKTRFKAVCAGRRFGKTKMCSVIAFDKAMRGKKVWWVAPSYTACDLGFGEIEALFRQIPALYSKLIISRTKPKKIELPNGGFIAFKSANRADFSRGEGLDYMIIDEADFLEEVAENNGKTWNEVLRPTLVDHKGGAILISTPNIENGWFHKFWLKGQKGDNPQYKSWSYSSYTNPFIDASEIDDVKVDTPSITFRREYMAEFVSSAGARIQRAWLEDRYLDMPQKSVLDQMSISMGVDLAISEKKTADYTACAILGRDVKGSVYVLDVRRMRGSFQSQIAFIKQQADKWNPSYIGIEKVGYQDVMVQTISRATNYAVVGVPANKDKIFRFAPLEARYERKEVYHVRGLPPEFETELFGFPVAEHDDQIDAMSIAWAVLGIPQGAGAITGVFSGNSGSLGDFGNDSSMDIEDVPWPE
jgi:predicted phage terminase large subunit-like protein